MNKSALLLFCMAPLAAAGIPAVSQPAASQSVAPLAFARSKQMIVVVTPGWDAVQGRLERFERGDAHGSWHAVGDPIWIVVGSRGMGWGIGLIDAGKQGVRSETEPMRRRR